MAIFNGFLVLTDKTLQGVKKIYREKSLPLYLCDSLG